MEMNEKNKVKSGKGWAEQKIKEGWQKPTEEKWVGKTMSSETVKYKTALRNQDHETMSIQQTLADR